MGKRFVTYDKATGEVQTITTVSQDKDMEFNIPEGCGSLELETDEYTGYTYEWQVKDKKLAKKSKTERDKQKEQKEKDKHII